MNIIVFIKQVPEMERVKFDKEKGVVDRKSAGVEINPFDLNALETAVQIKEEIGAQITTISMGPDRAEEALKESIARGADEGILLTDKEFAAADTIATSFTLAAAVKKIGSFDLIIAGEMTVDGDTAQVGPQAAEFLDIPHIAYVTEIEAIEKKGLSLVSNTWGTSYLKRLEYPGLITVTKDINIPRLPSFKDKMKARKAEIEKWNLDTFGDELTGEEVGLEGSPTRVRQIKVPPPVERKGKFWREKDLSSALTEIETVLKEKHLIGG